MGECVCASSSKLVRCEGVEGAVFSGLLFKLNRWDGNTHCIRYRIALVGTCEHVSAFFVIAPDLNLHFHGT